MKARDKWLMLAADILAWEISHSRDGQLLSEECDRWIARNPVLARTVIVTLGAVLTAHLANLIPSPNRFDPISVEFWEKFFN